MLSPKVRQLYFPSLDLESIQGFIPSANIDDLFIYVNILLYEIYNTEFVGLGFLISTNGEVEPLGVATGIGVVLE